MSATCTTRQCAGMHGRPCAQQQQHASRRSAWETVLESHTDRCQGAGFKCCSTTRGQLFKQKASQNETMRSKQTEAHPDGCKGARHVTDLACPVREYHRARRKHLAMPAFWTFASADMLCRSRHATGPAHACSQDAGSARRPLAPQVTPLQRSCGSDLTACAPAHTILKPTCCTFASSHLQEDAHRRGTCPQRMSTCSFKRRRQRTCK